MNKPIEIVESFVPTWEGMKVDKDHLFYLYTCEEEGISPALWPNQNETCRVSLWRKASILDPIEDRGKLEGDIQLFVLDRNKRISQLSVLMSILYLGNEDPRSTIRHPTIARFLKSLSVPVESTRDWETVEEWVIRSFESLI
jgi:hypothetical protein